MSLIHASALCPDASVLHKTQLFNMSFNKQLRIVLLALSNANNYVANFTSALQVPQLEKVECSCG